MVSDALLVYRERLLDSLLDELLAELPALLVVGPRAAGKTTTMSRRAATVIRLDREAEAAAFRADPDAALTGFAEPLLLDEWQNVPTILGAVRRAVESNAQPSRFFVTGSVRAELEHEVWPGTGRLVRLAMYPMTMRELEGSVATETFFDKVANERNLSVPDDPPDLRGYLELALRSGFPTPALRLTGRARQAWLESYIDDLLTHDVEQLEETVTKRRDVQRLRRYFEAYALNSAGVAPHSTIYEAAQINKVTAVEYDELLSALLIVEQVPAWASNRLKRLVRQPKRYVIDAALMTTALRMDEDAVLRDGNLLGRILDTFVVAQLRPEIAISDTRPRLYHLRTAEGRQEIDLVAELAGERIIAIEVKATSAPDTRDGKHLVWLRDQLGDRFLAGVVFHTGSRIYEVDKKVIAAPISALWGP
jgi:predicted AAA+ superfamily ATPase